MITLNAGHAISTGTLNSAVHAESKTGGELRLTIRNDLSELARVSKLADEFLAHRGADESTVYATQLALEEVLTNVIRHGYADSGHHEIALALRVDESGTELQIIDDGREFDPITAPEPKLEVPLAARRAGGLGIHLLRAFTREMRYERLGDRNALLLRV